MENKNWTIESITGYKPITTCFSDFCNAEESGVEMIQETYNKVLSAWQSNYKYITELALVLNWKVWQWIDTNDEYCNLYDKLWKELDAWCINTFKDEALDYYIRTTI